MTWSITKSQYVHQDRWLTVRADDCVTMKGESVSPYYVLEYPDWVHVLAIDASDNVILVRQYRHGVAGFSLELPGGMMDCGETCPVSAGLRELKEETGYVGSQAHLVVSLSPNPATHANKLHLVVAEGVEDLAPPTPHPSEDIEVVRVRRDEAVSLVETGSILNASHAGLLLIGLARTRRTA